MNVDQLQKINALANEFKKHNFAQSNEDAYKQAESVYDPSKRPKTESKTEEQPQSMKLDSGLMEKKIEYLLEMNNKRFEKEINILKDALNELNQELQELKKMPRPEVKTEKKPVQQPLKTETKEPHPKRGDYTSTDVDIQKMFYFGTKR